jgi:hypothetical protein
MTGEGIQPNNEAAVTTGPRNTHFDFQARVFQAPGAHFVLRGHPKKPMFAVDMGAGQGYISLADLRSSFFIGAGSHDDQLITRAEAGLHFVPDIRPGDEIPNEILDGTASWTVARRHKQIARDRLQVQLLSWMSGKPIAYANQEDLKKIISDENNKKMLKDAFTKAAVALGIDPNQSDKVLDLIETLAREICYIEALRERSRELLKIRANIDALVKVYSADQRISADLSRIKMLMVKAVTEVDDIFNNIDAETADVMNALKAIDSVIRSVRKARDDMHYLLMEWDPVFAKWQNLEMVRSQDVDRAMSATYQFLALRFSTGKSIMKSRAPADPTKTAPVAASLLKTKTTASKPVPVATSLLKVELPTPSATAATSLLKTETTKPAAISAPTSLLKAKRKPADPPQPARSLLRGDEAKPASASKSNAGDASASAERDET